jgi:phenylacetate-CoA ligase
MANYYQKEIECMDPAALRALQNRKLIEQVQHVWDNQPYYRRKMEEKGVTPADIKGVADLCKLPFLSKEDLRQTYPDGLLAVPRRDVVRIHSTSGTPASA